MARTSSKGDARERARQARLETGAERHRRDTQMEDAAARHFPANGDRGELLPQLEAVEGRLRWAVGELLATGKSAAPVATILSIAAKEARQLHSDLEAQPRSEAIVGEAPYGEAATGANQVVRPQATSAPGHVHSEAALSSAGAGA